MKRPKKEDFCKILTNSYERRIDWNSFDMNAYSIANDKYIDYLEGKNKEYKKNDPRVWKALEKLDDIIPKYWEAEKVKDTPYTYLKEMEQ